MRSLIRLIRQAGDELSNAAGVLGEAEDGEGNPSFTDTIGEELLEGEEKNPSLAEITVEGYPPEWIPLIILCAILFLIIIFFYWKAISMHKKYSTRHPIQFFCVMGILTLYPFFVLMNLSGMIVPKSLVVVTFLAEAYEGLSFVFFLRLVIYLMGGKKETKANLKGGHVHLNVPPLCCLCCLPSIKFSTAYYVFNECLILQYVVIQLIFGYIDLMMGLDGSTAHPADLIEEGYAHILYVVLIISLLVAIYGLSGIYHSAEETLSHYNIFKKFIAYKLLVSLAKVQSVLFAALVDWKVISGVAFGSFSDHLRVHLWSSTLIIVECAIVFPIAMKYYPVEDYPTLRDEVVKFSVNNEGHQVAMIDQEKRASIGERLQHHAMTDRYQKLNSHEDDVENGEAGNGGVALEISANLKPDSRELELEVENCDDSTALLAGGGMDISGGGGIGFGGGGIGFGGGGGAADLDMTLSGAADMPVVEMDEVVEVQSAAPHVAGGGLGFGGGKPVKEEVVYAEPWGHAAGGIGGAELNSSAEFDTKIELDRPQAKGAKLPPAELNKVYEANQFKEVPIGVDGGVMSDDELKPYKPYTRLASLDADSMLAKMTGAQLKIDAKETEVDIPEVEILIPKVDIPEPVVEVKALEVEVEAPNVGNRGFDISGGFGFGGTAPKVEIPEPETEIAAPKVEVVIPAPKVEVVIPAPKVEIPAPKVEVVIPAQKVEVVIPASKVEIPAPKVEIPAPKVEIAAPKVEIPATQVEIAAPKVEIPAPKAKVETPPPKPEILAPRGRIFAPKVEIPSSKVELVVPKMEMPKPAEPTVAFTAPQLDINMPEEPEYTVLNTSLAIGGGPPPNVEDAGYTTMELKGSGNFDAFGGVSVPAPGGFSISGDIATNEVNPTEVHNDVHVHYHMDMPDGGSMDIDMDVEAGPDGVVAMDRFGGNTNLTIDMDIEEEADYDEVSGSSSSSSSSSEEEAEKLADIANDIKITEDEDFDVKSYEEELSDFSDSDQEGGERAFGIHLENRDGTVNAELEGILDDLNEEKEEKPVVKRSASTFSMRVNKLLQK